MSDSFREEVAKKYPVLVEKAKTSRLIAIRLFCVECMGGSRVDAKACETRTCALWPHRGKAWEPKS